MVSFANGSLSGEASNKRPLENGYAPKYKPRKVSAIRQFPPMCGPNAVPLNIKPKENGSSETGIVDAVGAVNSELTNFVVANGAKISGMADQKETEEVGGSEMPRIAKLSKTKDSEIQNVVGTHGVEHSNIEVECQQVNSSVDVDVTEPLDAIAEKVMENVNVSKKMVMEIGPLRIQSLDKVGSLKNETIDNPIEVERNGLLDAYAGMVTTTVMNGFSNEVETLLSESNLIGSNMLKSVADVGDQTISRELCGSIKPETSVRPKDKYRPRRVSAFREFPPHCGVHVSLPVEGAKQMVISGNDCLGTVKVELAPEVAVSSTVSEGQTTGEVLVTSQKGCLDVFQNVPAKDVTTEASHDGAGKGLLGETAEGGLMDFENCSRDSHHNIIEQTGQSPRSGAISKAEIAVCSLDRNDKDGSQHGDFSLGNDSNREIVHGLMGAPYCPWRKSKAALKNSDGGTSDQKIMQQNLSQTERSTVEECISNINDGEGTPGSLNNIDEEDHIDYNECALEITPVSMFKDVLDNSADDYVGPIENDIIAYSPGDTDEMRPSHNVIISEDDIDREVVHGVMAAPYCPWRTGKTGLSNLDGEMSGKKKQKSSWRKKGKAAARKSCPKMQSLSSLSKKRNKVHKPNDVDQNPGALMLADDEDHGVDGYFPAQSTANHKPQNFEVNLPPFCPNSSGHGDARNKVRETLCFFHAIYRKLLQREEANLNPEEEGRSRQSGKKPNRIDLLTAKVLKEKDKLVNTDKMIGLVPGVEVGDEFQYRVELAVVGIHFPYQSGIDSVKVNDVPLATSIVASGGYSDNVDDADILIYSGQGGNVVGNKKTKQPEDQKLERGNLALSNSISAKTPVRVVRGWKEMKIVDPLDSKLKLVTTYIYDGLYTVTRYWTETGPRGKQVFQFELKRNPGQPELAWKELKKSNKFKTRPGTCVPDISGGKEPLPISAVNTLNDEKPPPFNYISKMMYPNWFHPKPLAGCDCMGRCSDSRKCLCAVKNGGELPYNRSGALVETKGLVYECGPHCKCPPSCYNRSSQRGIKFKLEIFKTESRGWGVRPLTSIPSGSFICEYAGELLEEKEAEQKIGNDEYLFDIGQNYLDSSTKPQEQEIAAEITEGGGFTIDACQYGNVGRFINHSCSPNLHAQNVVFDHDDKRMPHIMLFAMENIPPLQELTYHYNYSVDQIHDSNGNIKVKKCYCGSAQCTGRMY